MPAKTDEQLRYDRLYFARKDFQAVLALAAEMLKGRMYSRPRGTPMPARFNYNRQTAFHTALVVTYMRPFTRGEGWPRLTADELGYDAAQRALHDRLHGLRDKMYAHSDGDWHSARPHKMRGNQTWIMVKQPDGTLSQDELAALIEMAMKANAGLGEEWRALGAKLVPASTP